MKNKLLGRIFFHTTIFSFAKSDIATFSQGIDKSFCEAWERYKALLRKYPKHRFDDVTQLNMLYNGLIP